LQSGIDGASAASGSGFNMDMGILYSINESTDAALEITNILKGNFGSIRWSNVNVEEMPSGVNLGIGHTREKLRLFCDYLQRSGNPSKLNLGAEYELIKGLNIRLGASQSELANNEKAYNISTGVGFNIGNMKVDYAYNYDGLLSYNSRHFISLSFLFPQCTRQAKIEKSVPAPVVKESVESESVVAQAPVAEKTVKAIKPVKTRRVKAKSVSARGVKATTLKTKAVKAKAATPKIVKSKVKTQSKEFKKLAVKKPVKRIKTTTAKIKSSPKVPAVAQIVVKEENNNRNIIAVVLSIFAVLSASIYIFRKK